MPEDSAEFVYNPFSGLDRERFPHDGASVGNGRTPEEQADSDMFLRAVAKLSRKDMREETGGFALAAQCELPQVMKKKQKPVVEKVEQEERAQAEPFEEDTFLVAMRSVTPLGGKGRKVAVRPAMRPAVRMREETLEDFMAGRLEFAVSSTGEYLEGQIAGLDELIMNRLREGQYSPEAHIDLHGLNAMQAFESLREFMRQAWLKDLRTVLIVTGRGRNSPDGQAVLRRKLQQWLTKEPFKRVVTAFCTAKAHDGGPGSIYVLLRRFRKKGHIQWDRLYVDDDC